VTDFHDETIVGFGAVRAEGKSKAVAWKVAAMLRAGATSGFPFSARRGEEEAAAWEAARIDVEDDLEHYLSSDDY